MSWSSLRYLADWMEVGTTPLRWKDVKANPKEREERMHRTNVALLEYADSDLLRRTSIRSAKALKETLASAPATSAGQPSFRSFLVEDLSTQVVEQLGRRFDVDPLFFREQIDEYTWYNTRDPWVVAPSLLISTKRRSWFRVRSVRLRYFSSNESFQQARDESNGFNVLRRPDDDENHWHYLDAPGSIVAITRTRTTIWVGKDGADGNNTVAIALVDPTVREGSPLWYGHTNWLPTPGSEHPVPPRALLQSTLFETIKEAVLSHPWFGASSSAQQRLLVPTLYLVCAEWLVVCDYAKARLGQIEWELEKPDRFRPKGDVIDTSLKRLHTWRRMLPVFREMVTETLEQALPAAARLSSVAQPGTSAQNDGFQDIAAEYQRVLSALNELQARTDRLTSVVTSEMSIEDSRRGLQENHNLARLTWLATIFIPLTFVSGLFSMQNELPALKTTFGWYFCTAIPLTIAILFLARKLGGGSKTSLGMSRHVASPKGWQWIGRIRGPAALERL